MSGDSFFTLAPLAGAGLIALSLALAALALGAVARIARGRRIAIRAATALAALWLWDWLTPQIYYLYYVPLFDLAAQWVIGAPPGLLRLGELLTFTARGYSGDWARGALGWALLALALSRPGPAVRPR